MEVFFSFQMVCHSQSAPKQAPEIDLFHGSGGCRSCVIFILHIGVVGVFDSIS